MATNTDIPAAPTEQQSGSGKPLQSVPLPNDLLERIKAKATSSAPKEQVVMSDADRGVKKETTPAPAAQTTTPAKPVAKNDETPPAPPKAATSAETAKPAEAAAKPAEGEKPKKDGIAQVREALERAEARARELEGSLTATTKEKADAFAKAAELEAKVRTYDEKFQKEYEPQLKRLTEREKRLQEVEEQLKILDYTKTPEFHDRNVKPIAEAQRDVEDLLKQVAVYDANGQPTAATMQHFSAILAAPTLNEGEKIAKQLFGEGFATTELVRQSARIRSLQRNLKEAQERAALESAEYHKKAEQDRLAQSARFKQQVEEKVKSYLVQPSDEDPEEKAAFQRGLQFAERVEQGSNDPEQWADMVARVKATAASRDVLEVRVNRYKAENEALRAELAKYQRSEPAVETSGGGAPTAAPANSQEAAKLAMRDDLLSKFRRIGSGRVGKL